jgi:hypothetical protein
MKILLTLFFFATASCATILPTDEDLAIREAVVRYEVAHLSPFTLAEARLFFISFGEVSDEDPVPAFLVRISNLPRPVRPRSAMHFEHRHPDAVRGDAIETATGLPGELLRVGTVHWLSKTRVEVTGSFETTGGIFLLERENVHSRWRVVSYRDLVEAVGPRIDGRLVA